MVYPDYSSYIYLHQAKADYYHTLVPKHQYTLESFSVISILQNYTNFNVANVYCEQYM